MAKRAEEGSPAKARAPLAAAKRLAKTTSRTEWLREAKRQAEEMYAEARNARSYVAAEKCLRSAATLSAELGVLEAAELSAKGSQSEEGFLAELADRLRDLPTPYLERAVEEYLRRHPGVRLASDA